MKRGARESRPATNVNIPAGPERRGDSIPRLARREVVDEDTLDSGGQITALDLAVSSAETKKTKRLG